MLLKLQLDGKSDNFINYLKNFAKIQDNLLLEIDCKTRNFVAKIYTEDKASVRFSSISFDDCFVKIIDFPDEDTVLAENKRINLAIVKHLPKFIKMIEQFGLDVDKAGNSSFEIIIDFDKQISSGYFIANTVSFASKILQMKMDGFRMSELTYLSDEIFNSVVFNVEDAYSFNISPQTINTIIKTSDIVKEDPKKDALVIYVDNKDVYIKDLVNEDKLHQPNFIYKIGELESVPSYNIRIPMLREKFILMMDKVSENFNVIIGHRNLNKGEGNNYIVDRILFDSTQSFTKIVISIINEC